MAIDQRHVVNINGKLYLKYSGVLEAATEAGLKSLEVEIIQLPCADNGNTAVCKAIAILEKDGVVRRFIEIGDASPLNASKMVINATIRLASTRAKGRALRDAVCHGEALSDEIPELEPAPQNREWTPAKEASPLVRDQFCQWEGCGVELPPAVVTFSKRKYNLSLCRDHQLATDAKKAQ